MVIKNGGSTMRLSESVKPLTWVKANAAQMLKHIEETGEPVVVTKNGEAKAIILDIREHEKNLDTMAMLRMLADSAADLKTGRYRGADEVFSGARKKLRAMHAARATEKGAR
jgi:prevent-host-death family protein